MPLYYDLRLFRWFAGRSKRRLETRALSTENSYSLESLMVSDRSHIEDEDLRNASWYQKGLPREIIPEILVQEEVGSFIIRDSTTHPGCFALSVRVPKFENPSGVSHYLILHTKRGVKFKGLDKEWSNLKALVTHHTIMRELLPCTLRLPKIIEHGEKLPPEEEQHDDDDDDDGSTRKSTTDLDIDTCSWL